MSLRNSSAARVMRPLALVVVVLLEMLAAGTGAVAMNSNDASPKHVVVTTTLSGGGQSGASITVGVGVPVADQATLTKVKGQGDDVEDEDDDGEPAALPNDETSSSDAEDAPSSAQENANNKNKNGTITYEIFSDSSCTTRVFNATPSPNLVVKGIAPKSEAFTSPTGGVFYWSARYSGDKHRAAASSACGDERLTVVAQPRLTVVKHVINNDGGTKAAADFTITVTGGSPAPATFAGSEAGTVVMLNAGAYSVDEAAVTGYAKSLSSGCAGTIAVSETKTCTITNDDIARTQLTVIKHVVNDNGGTKIASDFSMTVTNNGSAAAPFAGTEGGTAVSLNPGSYSVAEGAAPGYTASLSAGCAGTIATGESRTCTITNNDIAAQLTVIKHVVNDNGGTKVASDFAITVTSNGSATAPFAGSEGGTAVTLNAGSYSVDEAAQTGYAKSLSVGCTGSVAVGETKTCIITNDDIPVPIATLTVIKHVINDNGGTNAAADFAITVTNNGAALAPFAGSESGTTVTVAPGTYSISEGGPTTYLATFAGSCGGTIAAGDAKTCTITNNDIAPAPELTVIKHVVNDNGGSAGAGDWTMTVNNNGTSLPSFAGSAAGVTVTLAAGAYSVAESGGPAGYTPALSAGCTGTIDAGEHKTCTITNDDVAPVLTVVKHVVNDNGGGKLAGDFTLIVANNGNSLAPVAGAETPGTNVTLTAGTYSVSELSAGAYTTTMSPDCAGTIAVGQTKTCMVTNDDLVAKLTVFKQVVNDSGGTALASNWTINVAGASPSPASFPGSAAGTFVSLNPGTYSVTETGGPTGYTATLSAECSGAIALGEAKTWRISNRDQPGQLV